MHRFDRIRQRVTVSQQRLRYREEEARAREAARRASYFEAAHRALRRAQDGACRDDEEARERELERAYQWRGREMFKSPDETEPTVQDWDAVREQLHRAVLLGDPGFGKTWLLKCEGRQVARAQHAALGRGELAVEDVVLPIYVRLGTLAEALDEAGGDAAEAILRILQREFRLSDRGVAWVREGLQGPQSLLLLDALDEVRSELRPVLVRALDTLARNTQGRILLTSRIVGYQEPPFPLRGDDRERELELVAFDTEQVEGFIGAWFENAPARGERLQATLHREPALRTLARIPLLLSFICLVSSGDDPIPTRRAALYEHVLRRLLEGRWRPLEQREQDPDRVEAKLALLEQVAWHFATHDGRWRDLLPGSELSQAIRDAPQEQYLRETASHKHSLLWELSERDGVLVKAGEPPPHMTETQVPYLFLHRTIHEYLVASHLARQPTDEWLAQVQSYFWFDPDWEEVIVLLAGRLADPNPLLETLLGEPHDAFHTMLLLAGRCLAETDVNAVAMELTEQIVEGLLAVLRSASYRDQERTIRVLIQVGRLAVEGLLIALDDPDIDVRGAAVRALGEVDTHQAVEGLLVALDDWAQTRNMPWMAMDGLVQIGNSLAVAQATERLLATLGHPDNNAREAAALALGRISDPRAVEGLLVALDDPDSDVREAAALALGRISDPRAVEGLLVALDDPEPVVRHAAAEALATIDDSRGVKRLLPTLGHPDNRTREMAAEALGRIGDPHAVEGLLAALDDPEWRVRRAAAEALGIIGDSQAVAGLLTALDDPEWYVREGAAGALGEIGNPQAVEGLLAALRDPEKWVRTKAARTMGKLVQGQVAASACRHVLCAWTDQAADDYERLTLYEVLIRLGPRLRAVVGNTWPAWRARLMPPTAYTLALGLARRPAWASQAERFYHTVLEYRPGFPPALYHLGQLLLRWPGRAVEAEALFQQYLEGHPEDAEAWNRLGIALSRLERHQLALDAFRRAAELAGAENPQAMYLCNCADACLDLGRLDQAEGFLTQAAALNADHPYLHLRHAQIHLARGELDAAIGRCRQALEKGLDLAETHFTLGLAP